MVLKVSIRDFKAFQKGLQREIEKVSGEKAKTVSKTVIAKLKENTPVDTGKARDGWHLQEEKGKLKIENEVEYIELLNEGHSQQAPTHFIENTVLSFPNIKPNGLVTRSK